MSLFICNRHKESFLGLPAQNLHPACVLELGLNLRPPCDFRLCCLVFFPCSSLTSKALVSAFSCRFTVPAFPQVGTPRLILHARRFCCVLLYPPPTPISDPVDPPKPCLAQGLALTRGLISYRASMKHNISVLSSGLDFYIFKHCILVKA